MNTVNETLDGPAFCPQFEMSKDEVVGLRMCAVSSCVAAPHADARMRSADMIAWNRAIKSPRCIPLVSLKAFAFGG